MSDSLSSPITQEQMIEAIENYVSWCGAVHDEHCPEDDTCDCSGKPINDGINAAINYLRAALSASPQAWQPIETPMRVQQNAEQYELATCRRALPE